ncbi:MAG: DUF3419 family protein, partial [Verrucomicrobiales bacterium]|nr:DUF3419 family protein [Verrucomicrobiales bacterium]
ALEYWDRRADQVDHGIGTLGKFEDYFKTFRGRVMPLIHGKRAIRALLAGPENREEFYDKRWNNWRWRLLFRIFFSRKVMGKLGRDPEFFRYVEEEDVAGKILERTRHALTKLDPSTNPYLNWILTGAHSGTALPHALREENFDVIRENLDRLEWRLGSIETVLDEAGESAIDRFNLSDIFEYLDPETCSRLFEKIANAGRSGGRLAYWNMLVPCSGPEDLFESLDELADQLLAQDKAFFYSRFVVEKIR